ncbi:hypothetical protein FF38_04407 [Lucilia cuprina]|uniref:Uncharacterized protein n=1 Tax=Lucilia cuprina TaxID=7375 RepID=A0A0L0BUD6_LUCCU|nr:hypothetical protein FF38_04407 [Lucilia cuprina]
MGADPNSNNGPSRPANGPPNNAPPHQSQESAEVDPNVTNLTNNFQNLNLKDSPSESTGTPQFNASFLQLSNQAPQFASDPNASFSHIVEKGTLFPGNTLTTFPRWGNIDFHNNRPFDESLTTEWIIPQFKTIDHSDLYLDHIISHRIKQIKEYMTLHVPYKISEPGVLNYLNRELMKALLETDLAEYPSEAAPIVDVCLYRGAFAPFQLQFPPGFETHLLNQVVKPTLTPELWEKLGLSHITTGAFPKYLSQCYTLLKIGSVSVELAYTYFSMRAYFSQANYVSNPPSTTITSNWSEQLSDFLLLSSDHALGTATLDFENLYAQDSRVTNLFWYTICNAKTTRTEFISFIVSSADSYVSDIKVTTANIGEILIKHSYVLLHTFHAVKTAISDKTLLLPELTVTGLPMINPQMKITQTYNDKVLYRPPVTITNSPELPAANSPNTSKPVSVNKVEVSFPPENCRCIDHIHRNKCYISTQSIKSLPRSAQNFYFAYRTDFNALVKLLQANNIPLPHLQSSDLRKYDNDRRNRQSNKPSTKEERDPSNDKDDLKGKSPTQ